MAAHVQRPRSARPRIFCGQVLTGREHMSPAMTPIEGLLTSMTARGYALVETHISWVLLGEHDVYKLKKPVDFGFLDFTSLDKRREACEAEVALNRRLSPEVYLGTVPVTGENPPKFGGAGPALEWAVHMRRLPDRDRADVRLAEGRLTPEHLVAVAERIAAFHAEARCDSDTAAFGAVDRIAANVQENFEQTRLSVAHYLDSSLVDEVKDFQLGLLQREPARFEARVAAGRVRDGHGDLRLEHVYISDDGELSIIDCIEFNERFRFGDVCADIAFLGMDLARLGHVELSEACIAAYARAADDYDLYTVLDFYESYRAYVRGKIASLVAEDDHAPRPVRDQAKLEARRDYVLAAAAHRGSLLSPALIAVGGIIATGKSTVAEAIAGERSAPIVDADRTRKHLVGKQPTEKIDDEAFQGAYTPEMTEQVYAEVLRRAAVVLRSGRPVIVDASFRARAFRLRARDLARSLGVPFRFVECRAPTEVCRQRLEVRARQRSVSDGRIEIFDDFVASWQAVDELSADEHLVLDTARPIEANLDVVRERAVPSWPAGLND